MVENNPLNTLEKILAINNIRDQKYGFDGNPFKIVGRLAEETGEVAGAVNHLESQGAKVKKHGEPSRDALAHEVADVILAALHVAQHYGCIEQVLTDIDTTYSRLISRNVLDPE